MNTVNEKAAEWWAARFGKPELREAFKQALLKRLPDGNWNTYNDYDPCETLLPAVQEVTPCSGNFFSSDGLLPSKTGLQREGDRLYGKEGYGARWIDIETRIAAP